MKSFGGYSYRVGSLYPWPFAFPLCMARSHSGASPLASARTGDTQPIRSPIFHRHSGAVDPLCAGGRDGDFQTEQNAMKPMRNAKREKVGIRTVRVYNCSCEQIYSEDHIDVGEMIRYDFPGVGLPCGDADGVWTCRLTMSALPLRRACNCTGTTTILLLKSLPRMWSSM